MRILEWSRVIEAAAVCLRTTFFVMQCKVSVSFWGISELPMGPSVAPFFGSTL